MSATDADDPTRGGPGLSAARAGEDDVGRQLHDSSEDGKWSDGFSLNAPSKRATWNACRRKESRAVRARHDLPRRQEADIDGHPERKFTQPIELFPFLMILLLLVLAVENLLANKFYRREKSPVPSPQFSVVRFDSSVAVRVAVWYKVAETIHYYGDHHGNYQTLRGHRGLEEGA